MTTPVAAVVANLEGLFHELLEHEGFGEMQVEVRLLKRGQKEVILHCGKQYRYVVDVPSRPHAGARTTADRTSIPSGR